MVVYMHVGAAKTGTTYVQRLLRHNQRRLAEDGVCYPGERRKSHYCAALDLRGTTFKGYADPDIPGAWNQLVDQIQRWDGHAAIIDHELFAHATAQQIRRALADLSFAEVHIIYTVRDLARQIPAMWQEKVKNGATITFADYLDHIRNPGEDMADEGRRFWRSQDYVEVLGRWSGAVPAERIHVVTVPPSGASRNLLWERFVSVTGLDPDRYHTDIPNVNASLGAAEVGALRRLNVAANNRSIDMSTWMKYVKGFLGSQVLAGRSKQPIMVPGGEYPWIEARVHETIRCLKEAGYDLVGDLSDLLPARPSLDAPAVEVDEVAAEEQLDAAAEAMAGLLERIAIMWQRSEKIEQRVKPLSAKVSQVQDERHRALVRARRAEAVVAEHAQLPPLKRIKRAAVELGGQVRVIGRALDWYRRVRDFVRARFALGR